MDQPHLANMWLVPNIQRTDRDDIDFSERKMSSISGNKSSLHQSGGHTDSHTPEKDCDPLTIEILTSSLFKSWHLS